MWNVYIKSLANKPTSDMFILSPFLTNQLGKSLHWLTCLQTKLIRSDCSGLSLVYFLYEPTCKEFTFLIVANQEAQNTGNNRKDTAAYQYISEHSITMDAF